MQEECDVLGLHQGNWEGVEVAHQVQVVWRANSAILSQGEATADQDFPAAP